MNWKRIIGIVVALIIIALVVVVLKNNKDKTQKKVYHFNKEQSIFVKVDTIRLQIIDEVNAYTGIFEPNKETKLNSEVQGKINSILVDVGSYVIKGQALIQLDNSLLNLQLQTLEVQIGGLQDDVNRFTILVKADAIQGVQLEKAQLGLKSAKVQKATLLEQINKTLIRAPFNGIVTAKLNEVGAFAAPGVPLLQITDIAKLRFTINVPENDLPQFNINSEYNISADVYPEIPLSGKVIMIGSKSNIGNSFPVQFEVLNTKNFEIKSGMFGKVNLKEKSKKQGIIIPSSSINNEGGSAQVYLVKNGKAVLQSITVSKVIGNNSVISTGLNSGDLLVTNGFINLFEGANVEVN